jgi:hypothetical protein
VKLDKLARQLRREAAANPWKTAGLGLMLLVALYFWAPLLWPRRGEPAAAPLPAQSAGLPLAGQQGMPMGVGEGQSAAGFHWERARQLIRGDSRMVSAVLEAAWVDPFARLTVPPIEDAAALVATQAPAAAGQTPQGPALSLTSVAISPRQRLATINGDVYRENDMIADDAAVGGGFRVMRIDPQAVVLEQEGRTFQLELVRPTLEPGDEIKRSVKTGGTAH